MSKMSSGQNDRMFVRKMIRKHYLTSYLFVLFPHRIMPRIYKRKTKRGERDKYTMIKALDAIRADKPYSTGSKKN